MAKGINQATHEFLAEFADKLQEHIENTGVSAHQVSQAAGVDPHSVYSILRKEGNPTADTLSRIGQVIKIRLSVDDIGHGGGDLTPG